MDHAPGLTAGELATLTATTAAMTPCAAVRRSAILPGTSFVDRQGAASHFFPSQSLNRCLSPFRSAHGNETKTAGPSAHAVTDEVDFGDGPKCREQILKIIFRGVEGEIPYVQFRIHSDSV